MFGLEPKYLVRRVLITKRLRLLALVEPERTKYQKFRGHDVCRTARRASVDMFCPTLDTECREVVPIILVMLVCIVVWKDDMVVVPSEWLVPSIEAKRLCSLDTLILLTVRAYCHFNVPQRSQDSSLRTAPVLGRPD